MTKTKTLSAYFVASLVGKEQYGKEYQDIATVLRDLGCIVEDDINKAIPEKEWNKTKDEVEKYYTQVQKLIKSSDIFIADLSQPSSSIGYEIGYAVGNSKPVLVLVKEGVPGVGIPFIGSKNKLLNIAYYNKDNLKTKIKNFIKKAEKGIFVKRLPIEFTHNQVEYVEFRQGRGVDRQSFNSAVREIVDEARTKDENFKKFLAHF